MSVNDLAKNHHYCRKSGWWLVLVLAGCLTSPSLGSAQVGLPGWNPPSPHWRVIPNLQYITGHWDQGQGVVTLASAHSFFCGLTGVRGRFAGPGEWVFINIDANDNWILTGSSQQSGVSADATCVNISAFRRPNGMEWMWGSWANSFTSFISNNTCWSNDAPPDTGFEPFEAPDVGSPDTEDIFSSGVGGPIPYKCRVYTQATDMGWGPDSVCYLTGFGGFHLSASDNDYYQDGEGVAALLDTNQFGQVNPHWVLLKAAWDMGKLSWGGATCIRFPNLPQTASNSTTFAYDNAGEVDSTIGGIPVVYVATTSYLVYQQPRLANKNDAFCVLSDIRGGFTGADESVSIQPWDNSGRQYLSATGYYNPVGPTVSATCIYYNQINPPDPAKEPFQ